MEIYRGLSSALSSLVFLMILLPSMSFGQESCQLARGVAGVCRDIRQCPSVLSDLRNRVRVPLHCGRSIGRFPVVCCPADNGSGNPPGEPDISPPPTNFECGKTSVISLAPFVRIQNASPGNLPALAIRPDSIAQPSVVGGIPSLQTAWPWMALLGDKDSTGTNDWFCAGSLINEQWILTAAHCVGLRRVTVVRLGEHDYENPNDGAPHEDFQVETIISHPNYKSQQAYHDLALIKLTRNVRIQNAIRPVCLPWGSESNTDLVGKKVALTGWGNTQFGGTRSPVLLEAEVTVFHSKECDSKYNDLPGYSTTWPRGIGQETVCAGERQGGKDACQGDSGGPIVSRDSNSRYVIAGVVSLGFGCGSENFPGLYVNTRQPEYLAWIKKVAF